MATKKIEDLMQISVFVLANMFIFIDCIITRDCMLCHACRDGTCDVHLDISGTILHVHVHVYSIIEDECCMQGICLAHLEIFNFS